MTNQPDGNYSQSSAASRQASVPRRSKNLIVIGFVAVMALTNMSFKTAHAQSDIAKESNQLLKDILRKRDPSQRERQGPEKTAPRLKEQKSAAPAGTALGKRHVLRKKGCPNIVGVWNSWASGLFGKADTTFNGDGTAIHRSGIAGRWKCEEGKLKIAWGGEGEKIFTLSSNKLLGPSGMVGFSR